MFLDMFKKKNRLIRKNGEREVHQPTSTLDAVTVTLGLSGQLEVIGKLDALAKSLRSSEAFGNVDGWLFLVPIQGGRSPQKAIWMLPKIVVPPKSSI